MSVVIISAANGANIGPPHIRGLNNVIGHHAGKLMPPRAHRFNALTHDGLFACQTDGGVV